MNELQFLSLGSGSSGNAYYLGHPGGRILIDTGIGIRKILQHLRLYGISPQNIGAILITHDHIDHARASGQLSEKFSIPVYATQPVWQGILSNRIIGRKPPQEHRRAIETGKTYSICGFTVKPFPVPHDSMDCVGYHVSLGTCTWCILTDAGHITPQIEEHIGQAQYLVLESNYDPYMLEHGPYPYHLRTRISGPRGHLSNSEAAEIICRHRSHLKKVWLCHISDNNNRPQLALDTAMQALADNATLFHAMPTIEALNHHGPTGFFTLN